MKNTEAQLSNEVERAVSMLMEHADTVQVFASRYDHETGETHTFDAGAGHWFARLGQVSEWLGSAENDPEND